MKLTREDMMRSGEVPPLDLFRQGIRAKATRDRYTESLRKVVCEFLEEWLEGDFEERVAQLVRHGRDEPDWTRDLLVSLSRKLRERTELAKDDPDYLNPVSFGNYFKPLRKLFRMNDVSISWDRVYATYPELDNMADTTGWTREEIAQMMENTRGALDRTIVLLLASSGVRAGALPDLNWRDLTPVYRVGDKLTMDPGEGEVVCAALEVYRGSAESYTTFVTPEAFSALQKYGREWSEAMGRQASPDDPMFLMTRGLPARASNQSLRERVGWMARKAGLRGRLKRGRRHDVPLMNGFRRFWNKTCKETLSGDSTLASLIKKEYMMGHRGLTSLDQNYFKTGVLELAAEYMTAVPDLTIDDSDRLRLSNKRMSDNIQKMEGEKKQNAEKDARIVQLEEKVRKMERKRLEVTDAKEQLEKLVEEIRISNERDMRRLMQEYKDAMAKEPSKGDGRPRAGQRQA